MRYENDYRRPAAPISRHIIARDFRFNDGLATGEFKLDLQQLDAMGRWEHELAVDAEHFAERAQLIEMLFPALEGYLPGQGRQVVDAVLHDIASNLEAVRRFYKAIAPAGFAPPPIVGRNWAIFRYIQVHLTADVELFARYGSVNTPTAATLENERADLNYLTFAVLAKGLATGDGALKTRFQALCPDGMLLEVEKRELNR